jgi:serine/threonine protein phosphatase PrpC
VANHPMRHVLTSVVGAQDDLDVTVTSRPCVAGDAFVLCSDGVHGALPDDEIARLASRANGPRQAAETLVAAALDRDGRDNLTAVVVSLSS